MTSQKLRELWRGVLAICGTTLRSLATGSVSPLALVGVVLAIGLLWPDEMTHRWALSWLSAILNQLLGLCASSAHQSGVTSGCPISMLTSAARMAQAAYQAFSACRF